MGFLDRLRSSHRDIFQRLKTVSVTRPMPEMAIPRVNGIIDHALYVLAVRYAEDVAGDFIIRDLMPTDLSGPSSDIWPNEASATSVDWATTTVGDGTAIADDTYLALWGVKMATPMGTETTGTAFPSTIDAPVTAFRITVGSSVVAQWNLYPILTVVTPDLSESSVFQPVGALAESPVIVTKEQNLKIEEYSATTTADEYKAIWLGAVAEKAGKNLSPPA